MNIGLNRCYWPATAITIPAGEPFDEFQSRVDGSRMIWPLGRFVILADDSDVVRYGGEVTTVDIPAGLYRMVSRGSLRTLAVIQRLGDLPPDQQ